MKRILIASILGIAASVATSYGDGYIWMENYYNDGLHGAHYSAVTIHSDFYYPGVHYLGSEFRADLLYSLNGGAFYQLVPNSLTSFYPGSSTATGSPETDGAGIFIGNILTIPGYTSGPVTFIVEAFSASSQFWGPSAPFTIVSLQTNPLLEPGDLINNNAGGGLQPFFIPIPEPFVGSIAAVGAVVLALFNRRAKRRLEKPIS